MAKVSVLIPVYNVAPFLEEAMESVVAQTLQDLEIICINDGSTDNSLEILQGFAAKDSRIRIIDKENGGYGLAMNVGFDAAKGEYIGILEPDDYLAPAMFADLYEKAKAFDLDFVKSDFYRFKRDEAGVEESTYFALSREADRYNKVFDPSHTPDALRFIMHTWCGIYRRAFLEEHHIRHHETPGASFQDNGFFFQTFVYAQRAMILDTPYYHYRWDNPNSSIKSMEKVYCINAEYDFIRRLLCRDKEVWERFQYEFWYKYYGSCVTTIHRIANEHRAAYIQRIQQEFRHAKRKGQLSREVFGADWKGLERLIAEKNKFNRMLRVAKEAQRIKKYAWGRGLFALYYKARPLIKKLGGII